MHPRVEDEWDILLAAYPATRHCESPERIETELALDNRYSRQATSVAVLIPPGYRVTGPDGFLIPNGLAIQGPTPLPLGDATSLGMPGWQIMSFHFTDAAGQTTWRPTADPRKGDNLLSYLSAVEAFLGRGCA